MTRVTWDDPRHVNSMYIRGYNIYIQREGEKRVEQRYVRRVEDQEFLFESLPPARPRGLRAEANSNGIIVSWQSPVEGAPVEGYLVLYNPASDPDFVKHVRVPGSASRVHLDKVKPLTEYMLTVRAFNRFGESPSYQARAKTPCENDFFNL
ncbi:collagen alpha-1(XII) chain [Elysia marginata]|uniref:Collagen alpha-1(XII) chain n=1 Tax=Elysia marginata TaxID=1093978 RepID=A0AAV4IP71_9GAST|nr:collagen alpha-1(XII) chain [Elysia marginata]